MNKLNVIGKQNFMGLNIPIVFGGFGKEKKCISDKTISDVHGQPVPEIRKSIGRNIERFRKGVDYINLKIVGDEITDNLMEQLGYTQMQISKAEHIYILSERGYAKLIKIMDTDLAWEIHDKLIDEYFVYREQAKEKPLSAVEQLKLQQQAILEVDEKIDAVDADLQEFKRDMPLLALECQKITRAKNQRVVPLMGGKDAPAYKDNKLRSRVYRDLEGQLNREFGVDTYKAIKRSQCELAIQIIKDYELPMALEEEIQDLNAQVDMLWEAGHY